MQSAYEEQLAAARLQLDQAATRQTLDQDGVKGEIEKLVLRTTMLEMRAAAVDQLAERGSHENPREAASAEDTALPLAAPKKPEPEDWDLRLGDTASARRAARAETAAAKGTDADFSPEARLVSLALSLDRVEREQARPPCGRGAAGERRGEPVCSAFSTSPASPPIASSRGTARLKHVAGGRGTFHPRR